MTNDQKKKVLKQYQVLVKELDGHMESYLYLRCKLMSPPIPQLQIDPVQTSKTDKHTADMATMIDLECIIMASRIKVLECRDILHASILTLPRTDLQQVMMLRYVNFKNWEQICKELCKSWKHIHRLHSIALGLINL